MATPAWVPGSAHSVSPTVLSTSRDDSVFCQSTGCEVEARGAQRSDGGQNLKVIQEGLQVRGELDPC